MDKQDRAMLRDTEAVLTMLEEIRASGVKVLPPDVYEQLAALFARLGEPGKVPQRTKPAIDRVFRLQERWLPPEPEPPKRPRAQALPT